MKNSNNKKNQNSSILLKMISYSVILLVSYYIVSCSRMYDNIEKYADGEIVYIDKLDGIQKVYIGYERVEIDLLEAGRIPSSQIFMAKAKKTVIECPDFTEPDHCRVLDSICSWVNVTGLTQMKYYDLTIYTEDEYGNRSLPLKVSVKPYTAENLNMLELLLPASLNASSNAAQIEWTEGLFEHTCKAISYKWQYTDRDGAVISYGDDGDKPVVFLENVASETDIPVSMTCRILPTISNLGATYIIDTLDFQQTLDFRLSSDAKDVIFLKTPGPNGENDLTKNLPVTFSWTKINHASGYTLKFSLNNLFPAGGTYSMDTGNVNEYAMNSTEMLDIINALQSDEKKYMYNLYWTVTPTVQGTPAVTSYRMLYVGRNGMYYKYDRTDWQFLQASSTISGTAGQNVLDDDLISNWHSSDTTLPHWIIIDMKSPKNVAKFDIHRNRSDLSDTKKVELYLSDTPDANGTWTKVGEGAFSPTSTGNTESFIECLTTDNVTKRRYLKLQFLDGREGWNPYVNCTELYIYYQKK